MSIKGQILPGHIPLNKYELRAPGAPKLTPVEISGIEIELEVVELPDRTRASGGQTKAGTFSMKIPMHHKVEQAYMESWFKASQDPVQPGHKRAFTLSRTPISGGTPVERSIIGLFPQKRMDPEMAMTNEGEMAVVEWEMSFDDVLPI